MSEQPRPQGDNNQHEQDSYEPANVASTPQYTPVQSPPVLSYSRPSPIPPQPVYMTQQPHQQEFSGSPPQAYAQPMTQPVYTIPRKPSYGAQSPFVARPVYQVAQPENYQMQQLRYSGQFQQPRAIQQMQPDGYQYGPPLRNESRFVNEWANSLFDCLNPGELCVKATFCPCVVFGKTNTRLTDPDLVTYDTVNHDCFIYALLQTCGFGFLYSMLKRKEIREHYSLKGDELEDCLMSAFCPCCAIVQQEKEVLTRQGKGPAMQVPIGYLPPAGMVAEPQMGQGVAPTQQGYVAEEQMRRSVSPQQGYMMEPHMQQVVSPAPQGYAMQERPMMMESEAAQNGNPAQAH